MAKDPAVLFFIDKWMLSTSEMDSDVRGWYLNLILHNYDKNSLPNDIEKLALLAGVKFSEFARFKQVFEQMLKQKFKQNSEGRFENETAMEILRGREQFKEKRSLSGTIGVIIKTAKTIEGVDIQDINELKKHLYTLNNDELEKAKDKQVIKQMLKHLRKLYINVDVNEDIDIDINKKGVIGGKEFVDTSESKLPAKSKKVFDLEELNPFDRVWEKWKRFKKTQFKFSYKTEESEAIGKKHLFDMSKGLADLAEMIVDNAIAKGYKGLFPLDGTGGQKMDKTDRNKATTMGALKILEAKMANNEI